MDSELVMNCALDIRVPAPTALNVSVAPVMVICVIRPNSEPFVYTCSENNNAIVDKSHSDVMAASSYLKSSPFQVCITTLLKHLNQRSLRTIILQIYK